MSDINPDGAPERPKKKPAKKRAGFEGLTTALIGNFAGRGLQLILTLASTVILARLLGPAGLGVVAIIAAAVQLINLPIVNGSAQICERELSGAIGAKTPGLGLAALRFSVISALVFLVIGSGGFYYYLGTVDLPDTSPTNLLWAGSALLLISIATAVVRGMVRGIGQTTRSMVPFNLTAIIPPMLYLIYAGWVGELRPEIAIAMQALGKLLVLPIWVWIAKRYWPPLFQNAPRDPIPRGWINDSAQFALLGLLSVAMTQLGMIFLSYLSTPEEAGHYRIATRVFLFAMFAVTVVRNAFSPQIAKLWRAGEVARLARNAQMLSAMAVTVAAICVLGFGILGPWLLKIVFGEAFLPAYWPGLILCLSALAASVGATSARLLKMAGFQLWVTLGTILGLTVAIALNFWLVPLYGALGCALAFLAATLVSRVVYNISVHKQMGFVPIAGVQTFREAAEEVGQKLRKSKKPARSKPKAEAAEDDTDPS